MSLFWFVLGAVAGSVANALIYRLPRQISWTRGHSICTHCKHILASIDLIPIFSYCFLRGKCRYCHKKIGVRYFVIELLSALGFVFLAPQAWLMAIFWVTLVIAFMDWETKLVSEVFVVLWGLFVLGQLYGNFSITMIIGLVVGVLAIGSIWAISRGRAMGFGDVEIAAVMGLWLGWPRILVALWLAFVLGGIVGVAILLQKKKGVGLKSEMAFGPFLVLGSWLAYFVGDWVIRYWHV